ncbi:MAG: hypothetical protein AAFO58_05055, partial [Pseudomonadota bacterium]
FNPPPAMTAKLSADLQKIRNEMAAFDHPDGFNAKFSAGLDPARDAAPVMDCATKSVPRTCGDRDGYDDTHAFLTEGIVDRLRMVPLSRGIGRTQWSRNWRAFPNVPIDHIYVPRRSRRQFTLVDRIMGPQGAREGSKVYGSDHAPLVTEWTPSQ